MPVCDPFFGLPAFDSSFFFVLEDDAFIADLGQGAFHLVTIVLLHGHHTADILVVLWADFEGLVQARRRYLEREVVLLSVQLPFDQPRYGDTARDGHAFRGIDQDPDVRPF